MTLAPPTAYQGGKQRLAAAITDLIRPDRTLPFYDLCCGSGAVAIEQVNRGHNPSLIHMVDRGPWGLVWEAVGAGTFDLAAFGKWCDAVPADRSAVKGFLEELSHQPADADPAYVFLLLQAGSFGSKAIWIRENRWQNCTFRSYWMPTPTSSRRSPVNPMMPMPATLYSRMEALVVGLKGVHGRCGDVMEARPSSGTVYVDPPYKGTTAYGHEVDVMRLPKTIGIPVYVSEGEPLGDQCWQLSGGRSKGGISGERKRVANDEWLSLLSA